MRLAAARLAVGEDGRVVAVEALLRQRPADRVEPTSYAVSSPPTKSTVKTRSSFGVCSLSSPLPALVVRTRLPSELSRTRM